ncbi:MAG: glycerophosphodiester phosphodiesterase [Deltaproteobacteria bacterium]|nr:glycerophosphodiester phosphodiesterase [Deltaproteobacteria bacterium]MBW1952286.1 glycerophosphodiester phosphodiesterase [Deltaproteobacteria bacterium]MBW1986018.1 glycerophosphodiester phosphodiesterase [Deltaproteobacteria bacterium]MBW2134820.1 glycerophosphodiester phosphodiesterase [Deltaproteobacteria bacterium]
MVRIMGHRGAPAYEPENTLRSIRRALEMGVEAVEIDVQLSRDGRLAVIHDETVDRTTNGRGRVKDLTWDELQRLDAGQGERIPALEEVVDLVRSRAHLVVELKQPDAVAPLAKFFQVHNLFDDAHAISFWHPAVKALRELEPKIRTGVLLVGHPVDPVAMARGAGAEALVLNYAFVSQDLVQTAKRAGLMVFIWNIDTIELLKPFLDLELDGIGSNRPDVLIEYLKTHRG